MKFSSTSTIRHPRDAVFATYRDRLPQVAAYLDDIESVTVTSREEAGQVVKLVNVWASNAKIPSFAKAVLKPEHLRWEDHAAWDGEAYVCTFDIRINAFPGAVTCMGTNTFVVDGEHTKVTLDGEFTLDVSKLGIPGFLARRIAPQIESFIVAMITPNLEKTNVAVGTFLDHEAS